MSNEFPDWFEILIMRFSVVYGTEMTKEKADEQIWLFKKHEWFNSISKFCYGAIQNGMDAAFSGRLPYPDLPKFCLICEEFHTKKSYKEWPLLEKIPLSAEEAEIQKIKSDEARKKCMQEIGPKLRMKKKEEPIVQADPSRD